MAADYCAFFPYFRPGADIFPGTFTAGEPGTVVLAENPDEIARRARFLEWNPSRFTFFEWNTAVDGTYAIRDGFLHKVSPPSVWNSPLERAFRRKSSFAPRLYA